MRPHRARAHGLLLALVALIAAACGAASPPAPPPPAPGPRVVQSNVLRGDYAGSKACAGCHAEVYRKWESSPMRRMTRLAKEATIRAPFDGTTFAFKGDRVTVEERGGRRYMRVVTRR